jgi:hypothetical protein
MRKSDKLREIYAELRSTGIEAPASDMIRLAHIILRAYGVDDDDVDEFGRPRDGRSIVRMPVDEAMTDGGWRVLEYEARRNGSIDDLEPDQVEGFRRQAQRLSGAQWHYQPPQEPI